MTFAALFVSEKRDPVSPYGEKPIPHPTYVGSSLYTKEPSNVLRALHKGIFSYFWSRKSTPRPPAGEQSIFLFLLEKKIPHAQKIAESQ